jgi:hypothetical protein
MQRMWIVRPPMVMTMTLPLVICKLRPTYSGGVKYAGCDGINQDGDFVCDNCEEDEFPPELLFSEFLPLDLECEIKENYVCLDMIF